jgi:hypothetical protein
VNPARALKAGIVVAVVVAASGTFGIAPHSSTTAVAANPARPAIPVPIGDADGDGDIDLDDLAKRVGDSKAIGLLTKLSLKHEIDGFKTDLKAVHDGVGKSTLTQMRERYDLMVHKLMTLLQAKDPGLAKEISEARNFLWAKLADPREFRKM